MNNQIPKFICYKCKYQHFGEGYICPKCSTNNAFPLIGSINLLLIFLAVVCLILSIFIKFCSSISTILFVTSAILAPFSLMECLKRNDNNSGFKTPETPNDIIENRVRIPDLMTFDYEDGLNFDYEIKKLIFDIAPNTLDVYKEGMETIVNIDYADILNIQIFNDVEFSDSLGKSVVAGTVGAIAFGGVGAVLGAIFGGIKTKKIYYLQIDIKNPNGDNNALVVRGTKRELECFYKKILKKREE